MREATGHFVTFRNHHASSWAQPWKCLIFICDCESKNGHYYFSVPPLLAFVFHLQFSRSLKKFRVNISPIHSKNLTICFLFCVGHANCFSIHSKNLSIDSRIFSCEPHRNVLRNLSTIRQNTCEPFPFLIHPSNTDLQICYDNFASVKTRVITVSSGHLWPLFFKVNAKILDSFPFCIRSNNTGFWNKNYLDDFWMFTPDFHCAISIFWLMRELQLGKMWMLPSAMCTTILKIMDSAKWMFISCWQLCLTKQK